MIGWRQGPELLSYMLDIDGPTVRSTSIRSGWLRNIALDRIKHALSGHQPVNVVGTKVRVPGT